MAMSMYYVIPSYVCKNLSVNKVYVLFCSNKRDDFDSDIVNFPSLDSDVPRSTSYGVYISLSYHI